MQSNVDPASETPVSNEASSPPEGSRAVSPFGLDGVLPEGGRPAGRLERRLRRQAELYGPEVARRYLAGLLELDPDRADIDTEAERILGAAPGSVRRLIEGHA